MNKPALPDEAHLNRLYAGALELLQRLIATPAFSREEAATASILEAFFQEENIPTQRDKNNVWALNQHFDPEKKTLLLCSHHDTVRPNAGYTKDPFLPQMENGRFYGLGSNDAGGCLVSLAAVFAWFYAQENLPCNLIFAGVAEEEISGQDGVESLLAHLPQLDCALIGEPTQMQMAVAEKGLMVLDGVATGKAGHAAREEGDNALYRALDDIQWFRTFQFPKVSEWLGPVKMSVTVIDTDNKAHNVVPDTCHFVVDVRLTDAYTPEEVLALIRTQVSNSVQPRSMRLRATGIPLEHPLVQAGLRLGRKPYGSPTSSDKALVGVPALKIGPGDSARSHTADEYIELQELREGINLYLELILNF